MWNVNSLTRLFIVPAMKNFDALTALEKWTEENITLDYIVVKAGKEYPDQNKEQPFCPYLKVATYIGGDKNKAENFKYINNRYKNDVEKIKSKHHFLLKKIKKGYWLF